MIEGARHNTATLTKRHDLDGRVFESGSVRHDDAWLSIVLEPGVRP